MKGVLLSGYSRALLLWGLIRSVAHLLNGLGERRFVLRASVSLLVNSSNESGSLCYMETSVLQIKTSYVSAKE